MEKKHFEVALKKVTASLDEKDAKKYKKMIKDVAGASPEYMG